MKRTPFTIIVAYIEMGPHPYAVIDPNNTTIPLVCTYLLSPFYDDDNI